jgi:excisionase family DNA binding protein
MKGEAPMSAALMENKELTLEEVAERLRVSYWTARRRCLSGQIPSRQEGRFIRVSEQDLRVYIEGTKKKKESKSSENKGDLALAG